MICVNLQNDPTLNQTICQSSGPAPKNRQQMNMRKFIIPKTEIQSSITLSLKKISNFTHDLGYFL